MKKSRKWTILASVLALTALCVGAAVAGNGDETDPLVTLSYLEQIVIPDVLNQVETSAEDRQAQLEENLVEQIVTYKQEMDTLVDTAGSEESVSYTLVTLTKEQTMYLDVGCELMLRVGTAKVNANTSPALIDISTGGSINNGTSLTKNHLYMATIADRTLTPTADTVKLLVRGGYSVA